MDISQKPFQYTHTNITKKKTSYNIIAYWKIVCIKSVSKYKIYVIRVNRKTFFFIYVLGIVFING